MTRRNIILGVLEPSHQEAYALARRFLRRSNVTGVSIGEAIRGGVGDGLAICVHVNQKVAYASLTKAQRLPKEIAGIPVDVVERQFVAHSLTAEQRKLRRVIPQNPAAPGVEVAAHHGEPGTLGVMVVDLLTPQRDLCLLTAAHVLNSPVGTPVYQPGTKDPASLIGHVRRRVLSSYCDGALAVLDVGRFSVNLPIELTRSITGIRQVKIGDVLVKSGMMTGVSRAVVKHVGEFDIRMPNLEQMYMQGFVLQPLAGVQESICERGDSGAIWYDETTGEGVGIHIAGDTCGKGYEDDVAFACNLSSVLAQLDAELA